MMKPDWGGGELIGMWVLTKDLTFSVLQEFKPKLFVNHLHLLSVTMAPKDWFSISPHSWGKENLELSQTFLQLQNLCVPG